MNSEINFSPFAQKIFTLKIFIKAGKKVYPSNLSLVFELEKSNKDFAKI